ncbi:sugar ABC transporter ATP-binding protein [Okibacterium endophyticum]
MPSTETVLQIEALSKTFPGQQALTGFGLSLRRGEIHALVGENGSGKSTLIKCLSGYHAPDAGARISVDGSDLVIPYPPTAARKNGLAFIHQDLGLVSTLSVTENLALARGFHTGFGARIAWRKEHERARAILEEFGHGEIDPREPVGDLPLAAQTIIAVARALHHGERAHVIVLDEPTASMPHAEVEKLHASIRRIAETGVAVLYVSHRLEEIFSLCDRVTALRNGCNVGTVDVADLDYDGLVNLIVGDDVEPFAASTAESVRNEVALTFDGISGDIVQGATGSVRAGEIVGVTGLLGSGSSELGKLLFGAATAKSGTVTVQGVPFSAQSPDGAMKRSIGFVPGNRAREAILPRASLTENIMLVDSRRYFINGWRNRGREKAHAQSLIERFNVRPNDPDREIFSLSGGNQQKVVLAKWLNRNPKVIIFEEPVQGIDIGAKTEVYSVIGQAARDGAAVIVISTELEDLAHLCHRVLVMKDGRIVADVSGAEKSRERLAALAL